MAVVVAFAGVGVAFAGGGAAASIGKVDEATKIIHQMLAADSLGADEHPVLIPTLALASLLAASTAMISTCTNT